MLWALKTQKKFFFFQICFWGIDCRTVIGWNLFKYLSWNYLHAINFFEKRDWGRMLAFFPNFFDLIFFFWGIDCRTMIGWNLFKDLFCILFYFEKRNWGNLAFPSKFFNLKFFFEVLIVEPWLIGMDFFGVQIITVPILHWELMLAYSTSVAPPYAITNTWLKQQ